MYLALDTHSRESWQQLNEPKLNLRVILSDLEPRPNCKFEFKGVLGQKSIRVTKPIEGPKVMTWVRPKNETHEPIPQIRNPTKLEPQSIGPIGMDIIAKELHQKLTEVSGEAETETKSTGQVEDPIETNSPVAMLSEEEEGSVYSETESEVALCGSPPMMVMMVLRESSSWSLVWVDLAENIHPDVLDGVLVLGSTLELAAPPAMVGMEFDMDSAACVLELTKFDVEP